MKKQLMSYLALAMLATFCCLSAAASTPEATVAAVDAVENADLTATPAPLATIATADTAALDFLPEPVFAGSQSCDDTCLDELASCLQSCGTSGPACGCLPAYLECTMACGGC